ncbi:MAG: pectin esterase, partial [Bacteroidota bacterium]|nr:pectin esterase [Bacteroidota bacterium]
MKAFLFSLMGCFLLIQIPVSGATRYTVAQDGTGDFKTIQAAFDAVPEHNRETILIYVKKGRYHEKLVLDSTKDHVCLIGEDANTTRVVYDDHTGKQLPDGSLINTYNSQTFFLKADDFLAVHIGFENNAGLTAGQAVAVRVQGDRAVFYQCRLIGFQDTLFTSGDNSRGYFRNCTIEGSTDFIFGSATVVFDSCTLISKKNSHVTAASTPADHAYGYVFRHCTLTADSTITKVSLGRPWRPYASVVYLYCYLGKHILPQGWDNWKNPANEKTARYAEYKNEGPGAEGQ